MEQLRMLLLQWIECRATPCRAKPIHPRSHSLSAVL